MAQIRNFVVAVSKKQLYLQPENQDLYFYLSPKKVSFDKCKRLSYRVLTNTLR